MRYVAKAALAGMIILTLAACGGDDQANDDPLDGTSWELIAYRKTRPIPGTTITAAFEDGKVSGSAGCNSYSGAYQISGDVITIDKLAITLMACMEPEGVMVQEMMFMEFLREAKTFRLLDNQLQIYWTDHEALTFIPKE